MNRIFKVTIVCTILLSFSIVSFSQEIVTVTNKKAGKLSSTIKKVGVNTTHLKILGEINSDDLGYLSNMAALEYLDIEDVTLSNIWKSGKWINGEFLQDRSVKFPYLDKVEELRLPLSCYKIKELQSVPSLKILHISNKCKIENDSIIHLQKIYVKKKEISNTDNDDYYNYFANEKRVAFSTHEWHESSSYYKTSHPKTHKLTTEILILSDESFLKKDCTPLKDITPYFIQTEDVPKRYLNRWNDKFDLKELENIDIIAPTAFINSNLNSITIPNKIKEIPDHCFLNCLNLKEINLGSVEYIGRDAFSNTAIKEIIMPTSINALNTRAFDNSQIEKVEFIAEYPPKIDPIERHNGNDWTKGDKVVFFDKIYFIIPVNTYSKFNIGEWKKLTLLEKGVKTDYEFTIEEPGTLDSYITSDIVKSITSLTLKGFLYDTDFEVLNKCEHLRYLDLSYTFITKSPKTLKSEKAKREFEIALLSAVADLGLEDTNNQYNRGNINVGQHVNASVTFTYLKELTQAANKNEIKADPNCIMPRVETKKIKEIKLPLQLSKIDNLSGLVYLEKVVLPPNLKSIGRAFSNCTSLKSINFPASLAEIERGRESFTLGTFQGCSSLTAIDLSETQVKKIDHETFKGCNSVKEFRAPNGLEHFYSYDFNVSAKYYFKTLEKPTGFYGEDTYEIHIPKGTKAGWQGVRGKIIEDN